MFTTAVILVLGGAGGSQTRRAESSITFIPSAEEIREQILQRVRSRPLFGGDGMLSELRAIRECRKSR